MIVVPMKRLRYSFAEWNDFIYERNEKRSNKLFEKKKDLWFQVTKNEVKYPMEFNPCPRRCFQSESVDFSSFVVEAPIVVVAKDGTAREFTFAKRFRLVFNMNAMDKTSITVTTWPAKCQILIEATCVKSRKEEGQPSKENEKSNKKKNSRWKTEKQQECHKIDAAEDSGDGVNFFNSLFPYIYFFGRKFRLSSNVDLNELEATLTNDKQLIIEAPILDDDETERRIRIDKINSMKPQPQTTDLQLQKKPLPPCDLPIIIQTTSPSDNSPQDLMHTSNLDRNHTNAENDLGKGLSDEVVSPTNSNNSSSGCKEVKVGVPIFRDEGFVRRMYLTLNIGDDFENKDVVVQVLRENRVQITAKRKIKSHWRSKSVRFCQCYDLGEKIDPFTLRAGFTREKKLMLTALSKDASHHPAHTSSESSSFEDEDQEAHQF
ncbi:hypothetical protein HELRODRAFT_191861 [Helobdella robusta]|uniref:SHSP domain-containing protein n=1 Tax=Helobdella robusta TaxID=6412 RepID=T1FTD2_HELRO|nr:hypothetical protein HELRODRAFT_191861 [Helobdella robusta]ESO03539.1 hypothetical protein HELRODRAFT_191861 [Helobdella robusta]